MYLQTAFILATFAVVGNAAELSLSNGVLAVDKPTLLNVSVATAGQVPTGLQFDLEYDLRALEITVEAGPVATRASKQLHTSPLQTGKQRVLIIGGREAVADGVIAVLKVTLKGHAEPGQTFPIRLTNLSGTNAKAEAVAVTATDGSVKVEVRRNNQ